SCSLGASSEDGANAKPWTSPCRAQPRCEHHGHGESRLPDPGYPLTTSVSNYMAPRVMPCGVCSRARVGRSQDMSHTFKIAVLLASLCVVASAAAQTSQTTTTKTTQKSGVVEAVYGNKVVLKDADGTHEYTVPEGFHFQMNGKDITVAQLKPGMKVDATITE